jgi:phosphoribosyl-AMP cyclohydrolase
MSGFCGFEPVDCVDLTMPYIGAAGADLKLRQWTSRLGDNRLRDMPGNSLFASPGTSSELEEGSVLMPKFDGDGLVTCVATDAVSGDVLMVAHMNAEALAKTIATGEAWYFSRSRGALWKKGETSGHTQRVVEMRIDCDQDAVWIKVEQAVAACHTGRRSCFYRAVPLGKEGAVKLEFSGDRVFHPKK